MRKDWEYKKWADVLTIINGKNQKAVESIDGTYPIYGSGGIMGYANDWLCPENCTIIGRKGNINKPIFVESKFWNVDTAFGLNSNQNLLASKYLYYFCLNYDFNRHNKAVTIPSLTKVDLLKIEMPLPPKPTQLAIVAELDKINELIQLKKQQLKDYDQLAQSIFYEMFGDPVENEKGWEVKKFKDVYKMKSGDALSAKQFITGDYPVYGGNGISGYHNAFNKDGIYIIIGRVGVYCGNTRIVNNKFWLTDNAFELMYDKSSNNELFICTLLNCLNLRQYANAAAQPVISNTTLKDILIPLPPLPLQQQFAARIEAIERQKQQVSETIKDLETLLASRMQYWFD